MLDERAELYLMDFGLAGLLEQQSHRETKDGSFWARSATCRPSKPNVRSTVSDRPPINIARRLCFMKCSRANCPLLASPQAP